MSSSSSIAPLFRSTEEQLTPLTATVTEEIDISLRNYRSCINYYLINYASRLARYSKFSQDDATPLAPDEFSISVKYEPKKMIADHGSIIHKQTLQERVHRKC
ncbi:hypothetical protein J6590_101559 [Homalodisca vitripennis]|nr:hypothetical protein J6590_101559 [Homalodisca vitripennis]